MHARPNPTRTVVTAQVANHTVPLVVRAMLGATGLVLGTQAQSNLVYLPDKPYMFGTLAGGHLIAQLESTPAQRLCVDGLLHFWGVPLRALGPYFGWTVWGVKFEFMETPARTGAYTVAVTFEDDDETTPVGHAVIRTLREAAQSVVALQISSAAAEIFPDLPHQDS